MNLNPIVSKLEADGVGTAGKSIFINFMPFEVKTGLLLRSPLSGMDIDHELPGYFKGEFIVVARSPDYIKALELMREVMLSLTVYNQDIDTISVKYMRPNTLPVSFPVSDGQFYEVQVRFDIAYDGDRYGYAA